MSSSIWIFWALLSAFFAALTAIFAKVGVQNIDSDYATLIRTAVVLIVLAVFVIATGKFSNPLLLSTRSWIFLTLSALATGASWVCYFRALQLGDVAKVAPVDKLSVVLVAIFASCFLGEQHSLREWLGIALVAIGVVVLAFKP
jgi:transporter family protein